MKNEKSPTLMKNFIMNTILTTSNFIFPLITFPYVSRVLSADGYGKVQMATAFISYFVLIAQLGIPTYGIRACATVKDNKLELSRVVHELTLIQTVMMLISYAMFFLCMETIPKIREEKILYLVASLSIFFSCIGVEWLFRVLDQYTYITTRSLVFKMISIICMFLLVRSQDDYIWYTAISILSSAGSNILNLTRLSRYIVIKPIWKYNLKRHLKPIFILFAYICATTIYTNIDSVMLGFITTDADVGYYNVAVKIKIILVSVITSLGTVLIPRVSYYHEMGMHDAFWKMAEKALKAIFLMSLPMSVFFMIFAKNTIFFLSGESYSESVMPMIFIMPTLVFIGLTSVTGLQILIPTKREKIILYTAIIAAVLDIVINACLIPSMKATGAAIGTLIAEFVTLVIQFFVLRHNIIPMLKNMRIGLVFIAIVLATAVSLWVPCLAVGNLIALLIGAFLFFGVYMIVLIIGKEQFILELLNKGVGALKHIFKKSN